VLNLASQECRVFGRAGGGLRRTSRGGKGVGVLVRVIVGKSMGSMGTINTVVPLHSHLGKCGMAVKACTQLCASGVDFRAIGIRIVLVACS
jgi:hypothetical protein